jgi:BCD family chlorophyll transporter-like MFS transporter
VTALSARLLRQWTRIDPRYLPFADAATQELGLPQLLRLSLFQVSVGMSIALLTGTLNRVMIVELGVAATLVATMVAIPLCIAPLRAFLGFRSDHHRSAFGWRRVPYLWFGTLLQFGGLAIMPFALINLSGDTRGPEWLGPASAALAFLLVGAGLHTTQTAGLALGTDLAPEHVRPRVVALLYVMLLVGTLVSALVISALLRDFSPLRLIQVLQGAALLTMILNSVALWKQEPRTRTAAGAAPGAARQAAPSFGREWRAFLSESRPQRYLLTLAIGTAAFTMQDILLEPYGGEILGMSVSATSGLTAILAAGTLGACALASAWLLRGLDPLRLASIGCLVGLAAFCCVIFAAPLASAALFRFGTLLIGAGAGLFGVGMLTVAMQLQRERRSGLAIGSWGAVQASAVGVATGAGGAIRDLVSGLAMQGSLGTALVDPATGYSVVYHLELAMLFAALVLLGPLLAWQRGLSDRPPGGGTATSRFGLAEFPG